MGEGWTGGQIGEWPEQRTSRGEVYSKQEDRTKSKRGVWAGGQVGQRSEQRTSRGEVYSKQEERTKLWERDGQEDR